MKPIAILLLVSITALGCNKINPTASAPQGASTRYSYTSGSISLKGIQVQFVGTRGYKTDTLRSDISVKDSLGQVPLLQDTLSLRYSRDSLYDGDVTLRRHSAIALQLDTVRKLIVDLSAISGVGDFSFSHSTDDLDSLELTNIPYSVTDTTLTATLDAVALRSNLVAFDRYSTWYYGMGNTGVRLVQSILGYQDTASLVVSLHH